MKANEWLKAELRKEYGDKADAVYSAIVNFREIQFSSPESQAKFEAILKEWDRRDEAETPVEEYDSLAGYGEASSRAPKTTGDPLAEYRRATELSSAERAMYVGNCQK